jgi:hypothetical protein
MIEKGKIQGEHSRVQMGVCQQRGHAFLFQVVLKFTVSWAPVILASQEAEMRRIEVRSQPGQIVLKTLSRKYFHKISAGGVAQGQNQEIPIR